MTVKEQEILSQMRAYGGSFVQSLARTYTYADEDNARRLREAFPEIWSRYEQLAKNASNLPQSLNQIEP